MSFTTKVDYVDIIGYRPSPPAYPTVDRVLGRTVKKVIFSGPATIVLWADGKKTIAKCSEDDIYDPEKGLMMAILKKFVDAPSLKKILKKHCPKEEKTPLPRDWEKELLQTSAVVGISPEQIVENIKEALDGWLKNLGGDV